METKKKKKWILPLIIVLVAGLSLVFANQIVKRVLIFSYINKTVSESRPYIYEKPIQRKVDAELRAEDHPKVSYFGFEVRVPGEILKESEIGLGQETEAVKIDYGEEKALVFWSPEYATSFVPSPPEELAGESWGEREKEFVRDAYGGGSDYDKHLVMLEADPGEVNYLSSLKEIVTTAVMVTLKKIIFEAAGGTVYVFDTGQVKGFQMGDPQQGKAVGVELFNREGDFITSMIVRGSQEEIDLVLSSFQIAD